MSIIQRSDGEMHLHKQNHMKKILTTNTTEHFNWGEHCSGWFFINNPALSILYEKMPAGAMEEKHYHEATWQFFFVLSGSATMEIDIPPKAPHKIINHTQGELNFLVISMPNHKQDRINI